MKTLKTWVQRVKKLFYSVDWYYQYPVESLFKWINSVTNLGTVSLILNVAEWKKMFGLIQNPQDTIEHIAICDSGSWVDWIKATAKSAYPEKGDCTFSPINAKWKAPDVLPDRFYMQAIWD